MPQRIVIANWKMSLSAQQSVVTAQQLVLAYKNAAADKTAVVCPTYMALPRLAEIFKGTGLSLGMQDIFWEERGAYTGEVSAVDAQELDCRYVILGHSERRKYLGETNEQIHKKVKVAIKHNLTPVICIGENWDERSGGQRDYVIINQLNEILGGTQITRHDSLIIAYEPVWAISTGAGALHAEPADVAYVQAVIRQVLLDLYGHELAAACFQVIYGGSVTSETVATYTQLPGITGVLVGSASLKPEEFISIIKNA